MTTPHEKNIGMGIGKDRKLLLYRLIHLVRALYPQQRTKNPFYEKSKRLTKDFSTEDKLLFHELLASVTLLNSMYSSPQSMVSSDSDLVKTLRLLLPPSLQLTEKHLDIYEKLGGVYGSELFTYIEACSRLKVSRATFMRYLQGLTYHGLIRKRVSRSKRVLLEVLPVVLQGSKEGSAFEVMQGEWKEYRGFVEL